MRTSPKKQFPSNKPTLTISCERREITADSVKHQPMTCLIRIETFVATSILTAGLLHAAEFHVSPSGSDQGSGSKEKPFQTISAAANVAQPGDVVTVHAGVYRERVNPPRGGTSDANRITYQAAPGEKVTITGSEPVKGWEKVSGDTWKVVIPNKFFGSFNPYADRIHGDWFNPQGRQHHTGSVYLNGEWFIEAASHLNEVLAPAGKTPLWFAKVDNAEDSDYLLNLAGISVGEMRIAASAFTDKNGELHPAACSEGGQCIGWIRTGSWLKFDRVNFGAGTDSMSFRATSPTGGGNIDIHADNADGEWLGSCRIEDTGDWKKWQTFTAKINPTRGEKNICIVFRSAKSATDNTTLWAQFPGVDPNVSDVEINVRKTVFTPEKPGINYITVRGFTLRNAATNWAPPTAGQIGLITAYWNKGWIIENNTISHSVCSGVALGKHSDPFDNTSANSAVGYVKTIELAHAFAIPWTKENIGNHIVRNNTISHCEQTGIVGSMGCSFSTVSGNTIHDIHVRRLFSGAEMAGIKFHGAIDTTIRNNHIYRCNRGIWLDWMAQGTRVTGNLLHHNSSEHVNWTKNPEANTPGGEQDMFLEVNHGPILVDNNLFLSSFSVNDRSQGVAFVHNLFAGVFRMVPHDNRETPYHKPHSTVVGGLHDNPSGDHRIYNNIFVARSDLSGFDAAELPVFMEGNVYLKDAKPSKHEACPLVLDKQDPELQFVQQPDSWDLTLAMDPTWNESLKRQLVTTELLGIAKIPNAGYETPDGSPIKIDTDYFSTKRDEKNPFPGPFEITKSGLQKLKVWPQP